MIYIEGLDGALDVLKNDKFSPLKEKDERTAIAAFNRGFYDTKECGGGKTRWAFYAYRKMCDFAKCPLIFVSYGPHLAKVEVDFDQSSKHWNLTPKTRAAIEKAGSDFTGKKDFHLHSSKIFIVRCSKDETEELALVIYNLIFLDWRDYVRKSEGIK